MTQEQQDAIESLITIPQQSIAIPAHVSFSRYKIYIEDFFKFSQSQIIRLSKILAAILFYLKSDETRIWWTSGTNSC